MFSKSKGTTASIVSVLVFVGCCAAMVADFRLWWLPICALPLLFFVGMQYKGNWDSQKADEAAEKAQDEEPYSKTWPFTELEMEPANSKREMVREKEIGKERKALEKAEEDTRLRAIRSHAPKDVIRHEMTDAEIRQERKDIENLEMDAELRQIRDEYQK